MSLVDSRFSVGRARWWRQPHRLSHPERSRGGSEPLRSTWMSKALQERTPVGQRRFTPLLQSLASRKPTSVLLTVTRRNSIVLIAGIKRNLYLSYRPSAISFQPNHVVGFRS